MAEPTSFAFNVPGPFQQDTGGLGGFRGPQIVGGNSTGQNLSPAAVNGQADFGAQLGTFVDGLLKPYAERKARTKFVDGMVGQMYAEAGKEIRPDGVLANIFGPSDYEEGAMFYEAQQRVAQAQKDWTASEDDLKRLSPQEVSKAWAAKLEGTKTGNQFVDDLIEQQLLEASGPMIQSVAKAAYKHRQETTMIAQSGAWSSGASAYQAVAESFANTAEPTDDQVNGYTLALRNFLGSMAKPMGQDDDSYQKSIVNSYRNMMRDGNGHAASALMQSGILDLLPDDDRRTAEDEYLKFARLSNGKAAGAFISDIDALRGKIEFAEISGPAAVAEARRINELIKRKTGFDFDYFDVSDETSMMNSIWSAAKSAAQRAEDQAFALNLEGIRAQNARELEDHKVQLKADAAALAYQSDSPGSAVAAGAVDSEAMAATLYKGYQDNDFAGLNRSYKDGIPVPPNVSNAIQNTVQSTVYSGWTKEFDNLHAKFEGMMQVNPAMAKGYFGQQNWAAMLNYRRQVQGGATKQVAFALAFGDDIQYNVDGSQNAKARADVLEYVQREGWGAWAGRWITGGSRLNSSGARELASMVSRDVAMDSKFGGGALDNNTLMATTLENVTNTGAFEKVGPLGWSNRPGTTPLWKLLGYTPGTKGEAEDVILATVNYELKKAGFEDGAYADQYNIVRGKFNGQPTLIVVPVEDGVLVHRKSAVITLDRLKGTRDRLKKLSMPNKGMTPQQQAVADYGSKPLSSFKRKQVSDLLRWAERNVANNLGNQAYYKRQILVYKAALAVK